MVYDLDARCSTTRWRVPEERHFAAWREGRTSFAEQRRGCAVHLDRLGVGPLDEAERVDGLRDLVRHLT